MLFEPRLGLKPLAALCRRLATSLGAGVDVRAVWAREVHATVGLGRSRMEAVSAAVAGGSTISDGLELTGNYFPDFFRELIDVGEKTGHLPEVCRRLAEHYEHQIQLRRIFLASIIWPAIELTLALSVIGLLIWLMGLDALKKSNMDLLGFGLAGTSGLITYLSIVGAVGVGLFFLVRALMRGTLWVAPVQHFLMRVPKLGKVLETFAISRMAWAMYVTLNSGMDLRPALKLSLNATHNVVYTGHTDRILAGIRSGREIYDTFREAGVFPIAFLDSVQVGEETGELPESMQRLAIHYQEEAKSAMTVLTVLLGVAIWCMIAAIIIFFIFRIAGSYVKMIDDVSKGKF